MALQCRCFKFVFFYNKRAERATLHGLSFATKSLIMTKELVINAQKDQIAIALLEDKSLVELHKDSLQHSFVVGNIYLGRVKKLMPGLNAAFIDIGSEKEAFIHYHDLGQQFLTFNNYVRQVLDDRKHEPKVKRMPDLPKDGQIKDVLQQGQFIMVQIVKEPINTKGPRLTGEISIAGRNMVLLPLGDKVSVSQKIKSNEERVRLRKLVQSIKSPSFGVIIRTVAEEKRVAELDNELKMMEKRWIKVVNELRRAKGVSLLMEESSRTVSILRDLFTTEFEAIHVNSLSAYDEVVSYVEMIAPELKSIVKLYDGELTIFDNFAITKQIKSLFGRTVSFKRGAYLIMDKAEAMHVIDVNSGTRTKASQTQEENALEVNMAAATEIARQLRLRDMGGIIVIDFIDMNEGINRNQLFEHMQQLMSADRARHNILPLSKFGLMQITRQRVRPALEVDTAETCPTCFGTGKAKPSILFTDQLEEKFEIIKEAYNTTRFTIHLHPYVAAYIKSGFPSQLLRWKMKYGFGVRILPVQDLGFLQYRFVDKNGDELDLNSTQAMLDE